MSFPIKVCAICGEEFELKPDKPGFANRCPDCTEDEPHRESGRSNPKESDADLNEARRKAMRELLYRKDS